MHEDPEIERGAAIMLALNGIGYLANNLARWSHKADAAGVYMRDSYIKLLIEDYEQLGKRMAELKQAMAPAPVQNVSHETKEIAA